MLISISCPSLVTLWVVIQKIYSKMYLVSCTNTHRDVTDSINHGMVKNTKTWISWERNILFLWNKKILNLCLRWHILRIYCFVAELTFNEELKNYINKFCYHSLCSIEIPWQFFEKNPFNNRVQIKSSNFVFSK